MMRLTILAAIVAVLAVGHWASPSEAQPLEQNFTFGAPPDVLGNNRIRVRRPIRASSQLRSARGTVGVRLRHRQR